jgi:tetratricopeptide (TPR) repeat protein
VTRAERGGLWVVLLAALFAYAPALAGTFVYDDLHSVRDNPGLRPENCLRFFHDPSLFSSLEARMYRPVLLATFAGCATFGMHPLPFKLFDLLLHAATAGLVWAVVRRWRTPAWSGWSPPAVAAGLWFAVHPLASEAVNMVSARSEQLLVAAMLLGLLLHDRAAGRARRFAAGSAVAAFVACGAKETGVLLPLLLLALERLRARDGRSWLGAALVRLAPALAVAGAYLLTRRLVLGLATAHLPVLTGGADVHAGGGRDLVTQLATMATLLPRALGQAILPLGLSLDPPVVWQRSLLALPVLLGIGLIAGLTWTGWRCRNERPLAALGVAFAWSTALPWVLIPLNSPLCEHRLYGTLAGLAFALAALWPPGWTPARLAHAAAPVTVALLFALASGARSLDYRSEERLWQVELARGNPSAKACFGLALAHHERGELAQARQRLEQALHLRPGHVPALRTLAEVHLALGRDGDPFTAVVIAERLCADAPLSPFHHLLRSRALRAAGERSGESAWFDAAVDAALHCLQIAEPKGLVYRIAADARRAQGDLAAAIELLDRSLAAGLDHPSVRVHRARLLREAGRGAEASRELRALMAVAPFDPDVQAFAAESAAAPR